LNKLLSLDGDARRRGVVACSAGNFAQAVAYHARRLGVSASIVMPVSTPNNKVSRTAVLGAEIVLHGADVDESSAYAAELAERTDRTFMRPFDDELVIAGQGTVALEMLADVGDLDVVVVPVGGGGLIAGMAVATEGRASIVGVQSEVYPSMIASVRGDEAPAGGPTIAEGIAVRHAGRLTTEIVRALDVELMTVTEPHIEEAIALYLEIEKVVAEGAGAAALAALLEHPERFRGARVGLVLSGGNIDLQLLGSVIMRSLVRTGRLATLRIAVSDAPGSLARVTKIVGESGGNIIDVQHRRHILAVPSRAAQLEMTVDVVGPDVTTEMISRLREAGFDVETVQGGLA
jgi:threonine dehydratase